MTNVLLHILSITQGQLPLSDQLQSPTKRTDEQKPNETIHNSEESNHLTTSSGRIYSRKSSAVDNVMKSVMKLMCKSNKNGKIDVNISNNETMIGSPPLKSNSNFLKPLSIKNNDNGENNTHPHLPTTIRSFIPLTHATFNGKYSSQTSVSLFLTSSANVSSWDVVDDTITIALILFGLLNVFNYLSFSHDYLNKKMCFCSFSCLILIILLGLFIFIIGYNDPDGFIWKTVEIYNHDDIVNPLYTECNESYYELITLNQSIYTLYYTDIKETLDIVNQLNEIHKDYIQSLQLLNECDNIDSYKVNMIDELCGNAFDLLGCLLYFANCICFIFGCLKLVYLYNKNKLDNEDLMSDVEPNMNQNYGTNGSMDEGESHLELHGNDSRTESIFIVQKNDSDDNVNENENKYVSINVKCDDKITEYQIDCKH